MSSEKDWYVRPVFFVTDCESALRFYEALGFQEAWRSEEDGVLVAVQVAQRGVALILSRDAKRAGGGRLFFSLDRGEVQQVVSTLTTSGVTVHDEFWGMPVKSIRDPDDNDLLFYDDELSGS